MTSLLLRRAVRAAGFGALTIGAGTGVFVQVTFAETDAEKPRIRDRWTSAWSRGLLALFSVDMIVGGHPGARGVARGRGRVVVANHRSIIDITIMLTEFGGAILSRGEVSGWPVIGPAAKAAGTIFVDRKSKSSGAHAIAAMEERLAAHDTICIFPEGTTFVDDVVHPFKLGAFVAAIRAGTPVVPVGLAYPLDSGAAYGGETFITHLARLAGMTSTPVYVEIGDEMLPHDGEKVEAFAERCRKEVERLVARGREKERAAD